MITWANGFLIASLIFFIIAGTFTFRQTPAPYVHIGWWGLAFYILSIMAR